MIHYHVKCDSPTFAYPEIVTADEKKSYIDFTNLVEFAYDAIKFFKKLEKECPIVAWTPLQALFVDGTIVTRHMCNRNCIEALDAELIDGRKIENPEANLRNFIYEG